MGIAWSTRANTLTLLRLLLAPLLAAAVLRGEAGAAALCFALAVASDFADGWVARRYGEVSSVGAFADHAVDAIFVTAGTAALACVHALPAPLPPLIACAFAQYALDSRAVSTTGLAPSRLGRWNGIAYFAIVALPVARDALGLAWPGSALVRGLGWSLVASTLLSMASRLRTWLRARGTETASPRSAPPAPVSDNTRN